MKKKIFGIIAMMLVTVMALSSCALINKVVDFVQGIISPAVELDDKALEGETLIDFANGANPDVLFESDGWSNGDVFNVVWKQHNVYYENGIMRLGITEEKASAWLNDAEVEFNYTAGEARTQNYYHYGDYEVSMKPSANPGTASTFFVCTGPYDLKDGVPNAHDEIDIEFLGNDTTHVQFNFFVDGKGGNEYMYDLGFDASEEFHTYGFRWTEDSITWFVDGAPVYKVTTDTSVKEAGNLRIVEKLPSTAGRILTNYWCGNERAFGWMGQYIGSIKDQGTEYQWMKTSAVGAPLNPPVDNPPEGGEDVELDWSAITPIAPEFPSADPYVVTVDGNKANVSYTDVSGSAYMPIELDVTDAVAGKNYVYMKVTNNGGETVNVRVNMFDPTLTGNNKATNISATMNGTAVRTDLDWGGSFFDIPAGESAELVVCFGVGGIKLQLMIDSSRNDTTLRSGNITVEDIKFATVGEVEIPDDPKPDEPKPDEPKPEDPTSGNLTLNLGDYSTEIGGNVTDGYGVNVDENNNINVVYTNMVGNSYKNFWANLSAIAGSKTTFSIKVTNNGDSAIKFRIDIESETQVNANTTCCNLSATKNGEGAFTDLEWGGSIFDIAAGETATLEVTYDPAKKPTNVKIFIDSCQYDDSSSHAGSVTISDLAFSGEYTPEGGETPEEPKPEEPKPEEPKPEEPKPVAPIVNISDLTIDTTTDGELIEGTGIFASAGLTIDDNEKSIDGFDFTRRLKLGGKMSVEDGIVKAGVQIKTNGAAKIVLYAISSSSSDSSRTLQLATLVDGALNKLAETAGVPGDAIAKFEFTVDAEGTYYIGSTKSGINIYYVAVDYNVAEEPNPEEPNPDDGLQLELWSSDPSLYTVNGLNVKYNGLGNTYACVGSNVAAFAAGKNTFTITITNNGTADSRVRIDIQGTVQVGNHTVLNTGATGGDVWTDAEWGGSAVTVAAGQSVTLVITYDEHTDRGAVTNIVVFVDAMRGDANSYSADVTLSGMAFSGESVKPEDPKPEEPKPEDPKPEDPTPVVGEYLLFAGNDCYTFDKENYLESHNITYTNVSDNSYQNVNTWIKDKAAGKTALGVTIKNNGSETVNITVKLEAAGAVALGEYKISLAAGESKTIEGNFSGEAEMLFFFIDTGWAEATASHAGDITISGINFK